MMGVIGTVSTLMLLVLGFYQGAKWLVKTDTKVEDRRRAAAKLAGVLSGIGLAKTPEFLIDYSVGDYSGMGDKLVKLVELFTSGEEAVLAEFGRVFERCLDAKLSSGEGRSYIAAKLQDSEGPT